jgi:glycosyltransferase involved in cell wall biosynthesis
VEPGAAVAAYLLKKAYGIPYVVSEHWTAVSQRTLNSWQVALARLSFPHASRILGDNSKFPADFEHFAIKADFRWLPNSVDISNFFFRPDQGREPMVFHCSFMDKKKRVVDLIRGFARCQEMVPEARLELVGDGEDREAAERLAHARLKPGSFIFHGLKPLAELADYMRRAAVFALPSAAENLPCVLINAMACGTPVVTTRVGDIERIVSSEQGILHDSGDIEALAQALKQVLRGERTFDHQHIAAHAHERFSLEAVGRILHEEHARAARLRL